MTAQSQVQQGAKGLSVCCRSAVQRRGEGLALAVVLHVSLYQEAKGSALEARTLLQGDREDRTSKETGESFPSSFISLLFYSNKGLPTAGLLRQ